MQDGAKGARWLLAQYGLKAQTVAAEVTENTQTALDIGRRFIQITRVLFGQCPGRVLNGDIDYSRVSPTPPPRTVPLTVTACCVAAEETRHKSRIT